MCVIKITRREKKKREDTTNSIKEENVFFSFINQQWVQKFFMDSPYQYCYFVYVVK